MATVIATADGQRLAGADTPWRKWVADSFPSVVSAPMGARHERLWQWFEDLTPGVRPLPRVEVWPRGGAKSSTAELGCARACVRLSRRYVLYVSETQEQADKHVQAIASMLETIGVERAVNVYGTSRGWRRQELRTANGFNVSAYGLDTAARGAKLDEFRPDLIILDDVDNQRDSLATIAKKTDAITTAIIPAGSSDCAVLVVQNLVHEESIVAQLATGRADFLHDREVPCVEPAVYDLDTILEEREDGQKVYKIVTGTPSWAGQSLAICEAQINAWGYRAFLREAQHEVAGSGGYFFAVDRLNYVDLSEVPSGLRRCRAWDLAATEGGGDHTAGVLLGVDKQGVAGSMYQGKTFVLDVRRGQWDSSNVRREIGGCAVLDGPSCNLRLPQDPGQAGKDQAHQFRSQFSAFRPQIAPVSGDKATRATGFAEQVNSGNVYLVRAPWNSEYVEELRRFREDERDQQDDQVDASSDAFNTLTSKRIGQVA